MPSKIQLDENLWFLYICLQKSDMKSIDFQAVGLATSLKPPAARMRYTRLRRQIESGTLIGTHGTPFASPIGGDEKEAKDEKMGKDEKSGDIKKRKRPIKSEAATTSSTTPTPITNETLANKNTIPVHQFLLESSLSNPSASSTLGTETKIKTEDTSSYETDFSSSCETSATESEDEMPLAKLSKKEPGRVVPLAEVSGSTTFTGDGGLAMSGRLDDGSMGGRMNIGARMSGMDGRSSTMVMEGRANEKRSMGSDADAEGEDDDISSHNPSRFVRGNGIGGGPQNYGAGANTGIEMNIGHRYNVGIGIGRVGPSERERAELRAVVPTGRVLLKGDEGRNMNGQQAEFWKQRYDRVMAEGLGLNSGDGKPRMSV